MGDIQPRDPFSLVKFLITTGFKPKKGTNGVNVFFDLDTGAVPVVAGVPLPFIDFLFTILGLGASGSDFVTSFGTERWSPPILSATPCSLTSFSIIFGAIRIFISKSVSIKMPFSWLSTKAVNAAEAATITTLPSKLGNTPRASFLGDEGGFRD